MDQTMDAGIISPKSFYVVTELRIYQAFTQAPSIPLDVACLAEIKNEDSVPGKIVGLFLSEDMARACSRSERLRGADLRWRDYTLGTIQGVRIVVPKFPLREFADVADLEPKLWMSTFSGRII